MDTPDTFPASADYRWAFELAPIGLILSRDRVIVDCNQQVCTLFETDRDTLIGQTFAILCIDPALSAQIRLLKHKPQRGSSYPAPDVGAGGCKSGSSRQSHDWRVVASRTGGGARIGP